jgi:hypothetical protein
VGKNIYAFCVRINDVILPDGDGELWIGGEEVRYLVLGISDPYVILKVFTNG